MKIGFILYGSIYTRSGGYLYDRMLVEYLRQQGDTVEIISLPWRNYAFHLLDNWSFTLPAGFDILIQDELNHPSLIRANLKPHPCPVVSLVHHLRSSELRPVWQNKLYGMVEKKYLRSVDGFVFNSLTTQKVVETFVQDKKPGLVAYPPTDRFDNPPSEESILENSKQYPFTLVFLGNVMERKGLHTLLKAVKSIKFNFHLDVIGSLDMEPKYARNMQDFVSAHGLTPNVQFHGALDSQNLIKLLERAHILVVPSSYEGFGIVYLEGMGFGLPAVGTTAGAAAEIIHEGIDGFLIEPGDSITLAQQFKHLNANRDLLAQMSLAARSRYLAQPTWNQTAQSIREFLLSFLG